MYNEEKKLITDIQRKKDLDSNLGLFADVAFKANFEYACHKFTLNYLTLKDMHLDGDIPDDPYIAHCQTVIDKLVSDYIADYQTEAHDGKYQAADADIRLISEVRDTITSKMKVLTSYTDAFEMYEYILNRKEYSYQENMTDDLQAELDGIDVSEFADEIFRFVFADSD